MTRFVRDSVDVDNDNEPGMRGYLAFPPPSADTNLPAQTLFSSETDPSATQADQDHHVGEQPEDSEGVHPRLDEERHKRLERERELGESSEIEWVRAGGILRDAFGRRDKTRTEQIRAELKLQEIEKQKMGRWKAYEERWRSLNSSTEPISFAQFPWPLREPVKDRDLGQLKSQLVTDFLFESLTVRTNTTTKRERIRSSLLRWHPDKIFPLLSRVVPEDAELVREGIHVVFGILKGLQDAERTGTSCP